MFEKEAEEYANQSCFTEMPNPSLSESIDISDEIKEAVLFGYNKANKLHYVKDGDLPKDEFLDEYRKSRLPSAYKRHYCLYFGDDDCVMGKYIRGSFWTAEGRYSIDEVVAWKEIVLPKEIKEND